MGWVCVRASVRWLWVFGTLSTLVGCSKKIDHAAGLPGDDLTGVIDRPTSVGDAQVCLHHEEGCPCATPDESVDCGEVVRRSGNYLACSVGTQQCRQGVWGACVGDSVVAGETVSATSPQPLALQGAPSVCVDNPCDPYCQNYIDTPVGLDGGALAVSEAGLTLVPTVVVSNCTGIVVTPGAPTVTVTSSSPLTTSPASLTFTAAGIPAGCSLGTSNFVWDIDRADRATISPTGVFSVVRPVAGAIKVTAYVNGLSASSMVNVIVASSAIDSNVAPGQVAKHVDSAGNPYPGTVVSNLRWLYPYDNTLFPLGLPAPVLQWERQNPAAPSIRVALRYPVSGPAIFDWSYIVQEPNTFTYTFPQDVWQSFEQSARGNSGLISLQRFTNGKLEFPTTRTVQFADGQLKGTVYYNSYNSNVPGANKGAVLAIKPGALSPTLAIPSKAGQCHVCHSLSADGTKLIFQNSDYDSASVYDPSTGALLYSYSNQGGSGSGNRLDWGGIYPDGTMGLSHSRDGYHAYGVDSALFPTNGPANSATPAANVTGFPATQAVSPAFSVDGRRAAFNFWSGTTTGGISAGAGASIAVMDFNCNAPGASVACAAATATSPWKFSNLRELFRGGSGALSGYKRAGWPSFLPDGNAVLFQAVARLPVPGDGSSLYTWQGSQSEIWMSNVTASSAVPATPILLRNLNGTGYIPGTVPGPPAPAPDAGPYHTTGQTVKWAKSGCGQSLSQSGTVTEDQLNYMPTVSPQAAGGFYWAVFTSRRLYGNIATGTPWEYEECVSPDPNAPPTKKLWVAAIDKNWVPGTDPSHPAFYLPGQELLSGNMRGFWAQSPCIAAGSTGATNVCETDDDCCGGLASPKVSACRIDAGSTPVTRHCKSVAPNSCSNPGGSCSVDADCCQTGSHCALGICRQPLGLATQTFTRDYVAVCAAGTHAIWRFFDWKATETTDDHVDFSAQTWATGESPGALIALATAQAPSNPITWVGSDVGAKLSAAGQVAGDHLRITASLVPSSDGLSAPVLIGWRQSYSCVPAE